MGPDLYSERAARCFAAVAIAMLAMVLSLLIFGGWGCIPAKAPDPRVIAYGFDLEACRQEAKNAYDSGPQQWRAYDACVTAVDEHYARYINAARAADAGKDGGPDAR